MTLSTPIAHTTIREVWRWMRKTYTNQDAITLAVQAGRHFGIPRAEVMEVAEEVAMHPPVVA